MRGERAVEEKNPRTADEGLPAPRAGEPNARIPKSPRIGEGDPRGHVFLGQVERDTFLG